MSLYGLQTALAAIVRCPVDNRPEDLKAFLAGLELDADEYRVIAELAELPELNKYGNEQANGRWELLRSRVFRIFRFADPEMLEDIWFYHFEPQAMRVLSDHRGSDTYSSAFLRFLLDDPTAAGILSEQEDCPFLEDLIRFELAEVELRCARPSPAPGHRPALLDTPYYRLLDLQYDIPRIILKGPEEAEAAKRPLSFALVRQGTRQDPKIYQVTGELRALLAGEALAAKAPAELSPELCKDLQTMGLA